jgi:hypothetical protein
MPHVTDEGPTLSNDDNSELLKKDETDALFRAIIEGTPLPNEMPDKTPTTDPSAPKPPAEPGKGNVIDPKGLPIQVLNGDAENGGAATRLGDALGALGFNVVKKGDAPAVDKTIIKYGTGGENAAATLAAAVPGAVLQVDQSMGSAVALVIGPGFDEKVVAPQAGSAQGQTAPPSGLSIVNGAADPCA